MMTDLFAARSQMAISLGFHIIFAAVGVAMPLLMSIAHYKWLKTHQIHYFNLTKAWSKGVAIFFAVGAVSGTVLSFELGLLWPKFMEHAGPIIGMPFSWEGAAFFLEAVALGVFLYGWDRIPQWTHWWSGVFVGISGILSALFVICANAWMNTPSGFDWVKGEAIHIDPWKAMFNPSALDMGTHMVFSAFTAVAIAVGGIHAFGLYKNPDHPLHKSAFRIAVVVSAIFSMIQPLSGDLLAKKVAEQQPAKLAAMESLFKTSKPAPLILGGIPDSETETVQYGIHVPNALSFLAHEDWNAEVEGLDKTPKENWPPVAVVHFAFQIMVGIGTYLAALGLISLYAIIRNKNWIFQTRFLKIFIITTPLGFIAMEAGWTVTEVGRQPWIIYGIMKTKDAVTPMPGLIFPMITFSLIYFFLGVVVLWLLRRQFRNVG